MSEVIGFTPDTKPPELFQGKPVDPNTGLIGFRAHTPEEVDAFHNEELLKKSDKQADLLAEQVKAKKTGDYWQGVSDRIDGVQSLVEPLTRPASGVLGGALDAANNAAFSAQGRDDLAGNLFETAFKTPIVDLPKMDKTKDDRRNEWAQFEGDAEVQKELERSTAGKVGSGLYNATVELLKGFTSPDVLSLLPAAANRKVLTAWLGQTAVHFPDRVVAAKDHFAKGDTQAGVQEVGIGLGEVLMFELGRRYINQGGVADNPRIRDSVDTGVAGSGTPIEPMFEIRAGESWKQYSNRIEAFQDGRKQLTDSITKQLTEGPDYIDVEARPIRGEIADGPGPITPEYSLDAKLAKFAKDRTEAIKKAGEFIRLARLQDNPVMLEGVRIFEESLRGATKDVAGGKLEKGTPYPAAVSQAAPVTPSLTGEWPPQRPPSRPDEGVVDPNAPQPDLKGEWPPSKDPLSKALEDALRRVLNVPAPVPSTKPADIRRQLEYRSRSMEGPAEAPVAPPSPAPQAQPTALPDGGGEVAWFHAGPNAVSAAQVKTIGSGLGFHVGNKGQADWVAAGKTGKSKGGVVSQFKVLESSPDGTLVKETVENDMSWEHPDALIAELVHEGVINHESALRMVEKWELDAAHKEALSLAIIKANRKFGRDFAVVDEGLGEFMLSRQSYKDKAKLADVAELLKVYGIGALEYKNDVEGAGTSIAVLDKSMLLDASQSPAIQSPSEPIKVDPGASSSVPAPQKVVKPWEIRQQLQERSRSAVEPIEKNTPQGGELVPAMPGVRNFVEVPDNHPVVQFWRTPDAEKYAGIKAREAFPNDPATAADVANEAYAHLYLKASEFPVGRSKAQPWALRTMSNYILDKATGIQRVAKRTADNAEESVTTAVDSARDPLPLPDQAVVVREIEGALSKVAETFNDADREIYSVMTGESALDFKGLAAKQGTSPSTISRRVREIRGNIIKAIKKDKVDVGDYMEVMEAMNAAEEAGPSESSPPKSKGRGIGGSVRDGGKFKGGKSNGEAGFSRILPALSRIIHGWMRAGISAARAVGHAVKMFGKGIAKWASLVTNRASYKTSSALQGFSRPTKPATPWTQISRTKMRSADIRHPGFFRRPGNWSSVDIFRKAGMTDVVEQALQHEDRRAEWIGRWTTPLAEIENRYSAKEYKQGAKDFSEYWKLKESRDGGKTQAQADADALAYSIRMSQAGMDMVEWVEKVAEETNKISRDLDVQVKAGNTWRAGNFNDANYPRRPAQWFKDVTRDPRKNAESKALMRQLQRDMVTNGNAKTLDAAEHMLTKDQWWDDRSGGYLANSEKARGMKLPDRVYEYSVDDYISYVDQVADRLSQIEAFGQDLMGTRDTLFEVAASRTTDERLRNALGEMREHYLGKHEGGNFMELARKANVITTGAYLGFSPLTAVRNVWGAQANAMYKYGVTPVIVASAKVAQHNLVAAAKSIVNVVGGNAKSVRSIDALVAQEIGAVQRDMRYAMVNSHVTNKPIINVKGLRGLTEENSMRAAMAINTLAERMGREITNAASETWMRHTASFIQWDPNHPISRSRTADLRRLNFTTPEIAQLVAGDPVLMDRFRRAAVQKTNFGYSASESSTLFDKGWMKVFGQFQRYGAQAARFVDNDIVKPMFQKEGGKWTPNFLPFIKLMILAPVLGELYQEMREGVFNKPRKTASIEEIGNTLTDDVKQGLTLMAQRYSTDVIYGSGLGIISDWFGMLKEFGERGRFKNPLEPPAFTLVEQFGQLLQHRRQRGLTFEGLGSDLSDFFKRFPAISQATGVADRVVKGNDSKAGKLSEANFVKQEAKALTERFARERGGEINTKFNSSMRNVDENTAELDSLKDAMLSGDSKEARRIAISFIESAKDTAKARRTVQSVVKMGHPLYNQTAGINTLADVEDFLKWLGKRAPSKVADFRKVALRYESSSP